HGRGVEDASRPIEKEVADGHMRNPSVEDMPAAATVRRPVHAEIGASVDGLAIGSVEDDGVDAYARKPSTGGAPRIPSVFTQKQTVGRSWPGRAIHDDDPILVPGIDSNVHDRSLAGKDARALGPVAHRLAKAPIVTAEDAAGAGA